jgi:predicted lysophospholipase L1 biosynthesis ABC-type transport system permease subunit
LSGRTVAVLAETVPNDEETRLLKAIEAADIAAIRGFGDASTIPSGLRSAVSSASAAEAGVDASGVLLIGGFTSISGIQDALGSARQPVVATLGELAPIPEARIILLAHRSAGEEQTDARAARDRARSIWIITIALLVTMICISNSLLMSVTERFKEIGTMKCLGALSSFIRQVYFIESSLLGTLGSLAGALLGLLFAVFMYGITYGFGLTLSALAPGPTAGLFLLSVGGGLGVSILAAIYPANFASRMVPATALRTNI